MNHIKQIYDALLKSYGKQGWWPIINDKTLVCEYYKNAPRNKKEALEICFGAILTQNTSWKNVEKAIIELSRRNLIDINKINEIDAKKLALLIKPSGYYNQKAKRLKNFCKFLIKNYSGSLKKLFENEAKKLRKELLSINGIGPETADSIILYAAKKPVFVVDAYTKRILNRMGYREKMYDEVQRLFMESLPNSEKLFNEYHSLLVELGKSMCRKNPLCGECPVNRYCNYRKISQK